MLNFSFSEVSNLSYFEHFQQVSFKISAHLAHFFPNFSHTPAHILKRVLLLQNCLKNFFLRIMNYFVLKLQFQHLRRTKKRRLSIQLRGNIDFQVYVMNDNKI